MGPSEARREEGKRTSREWGAVQCLWSLDLPGRGLFAQVAGLSSRATGPWGGHRGANVSAVVDISVRWGKPKPTQSSTGPIAHSCRQAPQCAWKP